MFFAKSSSIYCIIYKKKKFYYQNHEETPKSNDKFLLSIQYREDHNY